MEHQPQLLARIMPGRTLLHAWPATDRGIKADSCLPQLPAAEAASPASSGASAMTPAEALRRMEDQRRIRAAASGRGGAWSAGALLLASAGSASGSGGTSAGALGRVHRCGGIWPSTLRKTYRSTSCWVTPATGGTEGCLLRQAAISWCGSCQQASEFASAPHAAAEQHLQEAAAEVLPRTGAIPLHALQKPKHNALLRYRTRHPDGSC